MKKCKQDSNCRSGLICDERYKVRSKYFSLQNNDLFFNWLYYFSLNFYIKSIAKGVAKRIKNAK